MAFSRIDETDLLLPLHEGAREEPRWATFLDRLRRRTRADAAHLIITPGPLPAPLPAIAPDRLRPNRVYAAAELDEAPAHGDLRIMRVTETGGTNAILAVSTTERAFAAADSALLSALAPHLAVALAALVASERLRARLATAEDALTRTGTGWIGFDRDARVIDCDPGAASALRKLTGSAPAIGQRLRTGDAESERLLLLAAAAFADDQNAPPRAIRLSAGAALDALLIPSAPAMTALLRFPPRSGPARLAAIEALHGLTRGEARLAAAIADGASIAEAAAATGLTIETARNYSKRIYAKTGVRGQGELVRLLCTGVAALA
ncbi:MULTISPECIES: LuxR family transcriptional regulator [unclassified Sphingomonas]|uniref:helix-turn-helix transcriptional regulator n=1 Tax=unclassified Sphingomonas TaxID=196159 RepID=UPI00092AB717|nr:MULTISPECIES: LuxR family transcriptional regulator [unclassified Sphingomonas]MBN8850172.1 LuxR family transcriptional regulator [Sphingomonas sp.]OJV31188.1 MAG: hypothetical protein BGO24_18480 [Sphingomonas sp. 67-36]